MDSDYMRTLRTIREKLLSKIEINALGCWIWTGAVFKKKHGNYSQLKLDGKGCRGHRLSYVEFVGQIPEGTELDHLCRNTLCINPKHLEPVTHTENMRRRIDLNPSHCPHGHVYVPENVYLNRRGRKECRTCRRARSNLARNNRIRMNKLVQIT